MCILRSILWPFLYIGMLYNIRLFQGGYTDDFPAFITGVFLCRMLLTGERREGRQGHEKLDKSTVL